VKLTGDMALGRAKVERSPADNEGRSGRRFHSRIAAQKGVDQPR
jgi:hypothetical protein